MLKEPMTIVFAKSVRRHQERMYHTVMMTSSERELMNTIDSVVGGEGQEKSREDGEFGPEEVLLQALGHLVVGVGNGLGGETGE